LFYRLSPIVFMGGSLVEHGGQNPIEAVKLGASSCMAPMSSISATSMRRSIIPAARARR
jgi:3-deoxy-D-manno-octulosonic-acid transferase